MSVRLTRGTIDLGRAMRGLAEPRTGGIVLFLGTVRADPLRSGRVRRLDYEAHRGPAVRALRSFEAEARRRFPIHEVILWHRVGPVPVGDASVLVAVAAGHRAPAFQAARWLIETLKGRAPIWKTAVAAPPGRRPRRRRGRRGGR